ncbi:M15 family metallopeptidase [Promicromonospora sp. NPDC050262]|uniref:M15 family metallopeptidase n=1 Tax=Promicromonospora sp. NPDC050262 TaxID=3155036 RepID=UPI0033F650E4
MAVLKRAGRQAREQGADFSPVVAQAAAELGMLYTTYLAQQAALADGGEGLRIQDAPVARGSRYAGTNRDESGHGGADRANVATAVQVSYTPAPVAKPDVEEPETYDAGPETDESPTHAGYVTFEEVVVAAVRLAGLLDALTPTGEVDVQRTDPHQDLTPRERGELDEPAREQGQGSPLRAGLLDAVQALGGSTLGYANGRIPAAVLCPLPFAPGHLLRCDARQHLTALSAAFEREFGYPIPITDSYRSYVAQVAVAHAKPHLAAIPGTSNHGWGLAVDLGGPISGGISPQYTWLRAHGPHYGWDNPSWARPDGISPNRGTSSFSPPDPYPTGPLTGPTSIPGAARRPARARPTTRRPGARLET